MKQDLNKMKDFMVKHITFQTVDFFEKYIKNMRIPENNQIGISIIIICKNEERCIGRCLNSIKKQICTMDEIVVIDTGSTDKTKEIIKNVISESKIRDIVWKDDFSYVRNIGIDFAKNNWIFFIDADECLQEGSLKNLRMLVAFAETFVDQDFAICPTIVNSNSHITNGVRRIVSKKSGLKFWGRVHEEIRYEKGKLGYEVNAVAFDNIVLFHDGYEKDIIVKKDKIHRNMQLLLKMIECEPQYPRWSYFLARDAKEELSEIKYEELLLETVKLSDEKKIFEYYDIRALSDLTSLYISKGNLDKAEEVLIELKQRAPDLSDIVYFRTYIDFCKLKEKTLKLLIDVCEFRETHQNIEYGSIHSNYFHIDFLIAKLFFEIGEYKKAFSILKKLKSEKYCNDDEYYLRLLEAVEKYLDD